MQIAKRRRRYAITIRMPSFYDPASGYFGALESLRWVENRRPASRA